MLLVLQAGFNQVYRKHTSNSNDASNAPIDYSGNRSARKQTNIEEESDNMPTITGRKPHPNYIHDIGKQLPFYMF
jgi:hypothetical protein